MADAPVLDDVLRRVFRCVDDDEVRLFYDYFDELKAHARAWLRARARIFPGASAVAHSALLSLLADAGGCAIHLDETDEHGYPMLWPLLLKYLERHCNKWNKYYRAKKRKGTVVSLEGTGGDRSTTDPVDPRQPPEADVEFVDAWEALLKNLTERQCQVAALAAQGKTLEQIAAELHCSETTVSGEKKVIRTILETT